MVTLQDVQKARALRDAAIQREAEQRALVNKKFQEAQQRFAGRIGSQALAKQAIARDRQILKGLSRRVDDLKSQVLRVNRRFQKSTQSSKIKERKPTLIELKKAEDLRKPIVKAKLRKQEKALTGAMVKRAKVVEQIKTLEQAEIKQQGFQIDPKIKNDIKRIRESKLSPLVKEKILREYVGIERGDPKARLKAEQILKSREARLRETKVALEREVEKTRREVTRKLKQLPKDASVSSLLSMIKPQEIAWNVYEGVFAVTKDVVDLSTGAVKGAYQFGKDLATYNQGENLGIQRIKKGFKTTKDVAKFVKENPTEASLIVGIAAVSAQRELQKSFISNPVKTTTQAVLILAPGTALKVAGAPVRALGKVAFTRASTVTIPKSVVSTSTLTGFTIQKEKLTKELAKQQKKLEKIVKSKTKPQAVIQEAKSEITKIKKDRKKLKKLPSGALLDIKKVQKEVRRVKEITKAKGLAKLFEVTIPKKVEKMISPLFKSRSDLARELQFARLKGGEAFKKLKVKIKKETGLNVVVRQKKGSETFILPDGTKKIVQKVEIKLLEPKAPKIKPKKEKPVFINIAGKKAQGKQINIPEVRKFYKRSVRKVRDEVQDYKQITVKFAQDTRKQAKIVVTKGKKAYEFKVKTNLKRKKKVENEIKVKQKELNRTKIDLKKALAAGALSKKAFGALTDTVIDTQAAFAQQLKNIAPIAPPRFPVVPGPGVKGLRKPVPSKKSITKKIVKPIRKIKTVKKPVVTRPPKKPLKIIRFKTSNLPTTKTVRIGYQVVIKEGNKVISKSDTLLPRNRARNLMRRILDNSPQASGEIVAKGKTSIVDVQSVILSHKFRPKKSKNPKVRREVEKRKYRKDTAGEKKSIRRKKK